MAGRRTFCGDVLKSGPRGQVILMSRAEVDATPGVVETLRDNCHDMRQPLASMFALAAAALAEPSLPPGARARLQQMTEQAEWLAELIQHSLQLAAPDAPGACGADLVRVTRDVTAAECMTWPGEVTMISPASAVFTDVHPVLLRRMVANLVDNATRAAGPSGTVTVEVGRKQNSALLAVEDTGPGFGNKIPAGLGLGLAAVSRNAIRHGGRVECGCGASGGARVQLWLPLSVGLTQAEPDLHTEGNLA
jgi:K+-sensing histidine kinase KdpD